MIKAVLKLKKPVKEMKLGKLFLKLSQKMKLGKKAALFFLYDNFINIRWIVYDLEFKAKDGRNASKILYIMYSPDSNANNA